MRSVALTVSASIAALPCISGDETTMFTQGTLAAVPSNPAQFQSWINNVMAANKLKWAAAGDMMAKQKPQADAEDDLDEIDTTDIDPADVDEPDEDEDNADTDDDADVENEDDDDAGDEKPAKGTKSAKAPALDERAERIMRRVKADNAKKTKRIAELEEAVKALQSGKTDSNDGGNQRGQAVVAAGQQEAERQAKEVRRSIKATARELGFFNPALATKLIEADDSVLDEDGDVDPDAVRDLVEAFRDANQSLFKQEETKSARRIADPAASAGGRSTDDSKGDRKITQAQLDRMTDKGEHDKVDKLAAAGRLKHLGLG